MDKLLAVQPRILGQHHAIFFKIMRVHLRPGRLPDNGISGIEEQTVSKRRSEMFRPKANLTGIFVLNVPAKGFIVQQSTRGGFSLCGRGSSNPPVAPSNASTQMWPEPSSSSYSLHYHCCLIAFPRRSTTRGVF